MGRYGLQVLGRVDSMVKVLGSRVDLTEIKAALCEQRALVADAVITDLARRGADLALLLSLERAGKLRELDGNLALPNW